MRGTMTLSAYFTKFRTLDDVLECITTKHKCTCSLCTSAVNSKLVELDQSIQFSQFLMGLNYLDASEEYQA